MYTFLAIYTCIIFCHFPSFVSLCFTITFCYLTEKSHQYLLIRQSWKSVNYPYLFNKGHPTRGQPQPWEALSSLTLSASLLANSQPSSIRNEGEHPPSAHPSGPKAHSRRDSQSTGNQRGQALSKWGLVQVNPLIQSTGQLSLWSTGNCPPSPQCAFYVIYIFGCSHP